MKITDSNFRTNGMGCLIRFLSWHRIHLAHFSSQNHVSPWASRCVWEIKLQHRSNPLSPLVYCTIAPRKPAVHHTRTHVAQPWHLVHSFAYTEQAY